MNDLLDGIDRLALTEYKRASSIYGPAFHSPNELQGVLIQEVAEVSDECAALQVCMSQLHKVVHEKRDVTFVINAVEQAAQRLAAEATQVMAVCKKSRVEWRDGQ
jgi:hypothetical protein